MKHNEFKDLIILYIYNELDEDTTATVKKHIGECTECSEEYKNLTSMFASFNEYKNSIEIDKILSESRSELRAAISYEKRRKPVLLNIREKIENIFHGNFKPALGMAFTFLFGVGLGYLVFYSQPVNGFSADSKEIDVYSELQNGMKINNMKIIQKEDNRVEFNFDATKQVKITGDLSDVKMQKLFTYSILNESNPGVRLNTINIINNKPEGSVDKDIKAALIIAATKDENPGVRQQALKVLKKYPFDESIKQAYLQILINDASSAMRIEAINAIMEADKKGIPVDDEIKSVLKAHLLQDDNNYIQIKAKKLLEKEL